MLKKEIINKMQINRIRVQASDILIRAYKKAMAAGAKVGLLLEDQYKQKEKLIRERLEYREMLKQMKKGGNRA